MIKRMTTKLIANSISVFLVFSRTTIINNNINVGDHGARFSSIQFFVNQFKFITRVKFKVLVLRLATFGLHLTFVQGVRKVTVH